MTQKPAEPPLNQSSQTDNNMEIGVGDNSGQVIGQVENSQVISNKANTQFFGPAHFYVGYPQTEVIREKNRQRSVEIPTLLPYMANRLEQNNALRQFIRKEQKRESELLVIITHGDEYQCHLKFLERLQKLTLPKLLSKYSDSEIDGIKIEEHSLRWPSELKPSELKDFDKLSEQIRIELAEEILNDEEASFEDINQNFCTHLSIKLVSTSLQTSTWKDSKITVLEKLLEFWQRKWPQLAPNQTLIVYISIKYELMLPGSTEKFGLSWLFNFWKRWRRSWRRRRCQKINQHIKKEIEAIETSKFKGFNRLSGIILPELNSIERKYVEEWVHNEVKEYNESVSEINLQNLTSSIRDMYDALDDPKMSMEDLANKLLQLLNQSLDNRTGKVS